MTDTAPPTVDPVPPAPPPRDRFFGWLRTLSARRAPGWLGGVCAGLADRLGIDVAIVRGIVVVVAVLGGPALLLYALAWFLLPDADDHIQAEELVAGRVVRGVAGSAVVFLLSLMPVAQGFWFVGAAYWGSPDWSMSIGRALWVGALLVIAIVIVVAVANRSEQQPDGPAASAAAAVPIVAQPTVAAGAAAAPRTASPNPGAPPVEPAAGASAEEVAAWKRRHDEWRRERAEYAAAQAATDSQIREQRAAERRARAETARAVAEEHRRRYLAENPTIGAGIAAIIIGTAVIAGGIAAAVAASDAALTGWEVPIGFAAAALVLGLGMIGSGIARRRNGFVGFLAAIAVIGMLAAALVPKDTVLLFGGGSQLVAGDTKYMSLASVQMYVITEGSDGAVIEQPRGGVFINLVSEAHVRLVIETDADSISVFDSRTGEGEDVLPTQGTGRYDLEFGDESLPVSEVRVIHEDGPIDITHFSTVPEED